MKKDNPTISAAIRTVLGRKVKTIRQQGLIPSSIYGYQFDTLSIQFNSLELNKIFDHAGESLLVDLVVEDNKYPIIFKNPQFHPVSGDLIHIDCYKVNLKEKITATVPLELVGEAPATKIGNILTQVLSEIEVEALPADLPENIEVDVSALEEVDSKISVADLIIDKEKVEIKNDPEQVIVLIEAPRVEEEPLEAETETTPEDVPATAQKTEEEKAAKEAAEAEEKKSDK
ncbi:50S ribosomal protein L25 [Patescibacteria group bacterium]|nr:50S ribosomal protein L25 [Patescibacteria group bacterium]